MANDWRVKFDGPCARCGRILRTGAVATWDRSARKMRCVECPAIGQPRVDPPPIDHGVGGASARSEYERRMARRDAAARGKWGDRLGGAILKVTVEPQSTRAWAIGARGEEMLAETLSAFHGLQVLHDRRVPGTRGNIDHLVIAPAGIFVVDAKHYDGVIEIRRRGWFWNPEYRLYVGRRDRSHLAENLSWQVDAVLKALSDAHVDPRPQVTPVLCFIDSEWPRFGRPTSFMGVRARRASAGLEVSSRPRTSSMLQPSRSTRGFSLRLCRPS